MLNNCQSRREGRCNASLDCRQRRIASSLCTTNKNAGTLLPQHTFQSTGADSSQVESNSEIQRFHLHASFKKIAPIQTALDTLCTAAERRFQDFSSILRCPRPALVSE